MGLQEPSRQYAVRLSSDIAELLEERARAEGTTGGKLAKRLLIEVLTADPQNDPVEETRVRVANVEDELLKLRQDFWSSVVCLLVNAGKANQEGAKEWVRKNLMK